MFGSIEGTSEFSLARAMLKLQGRGKFAQSIRRFKRFARGLNIPLICRPSFLIIVGAAALAGCTNLVVSETSDYCADDSSKCANHVPTGFEYSLPQGRLLLTATRRVITADSVATATAAASNAISLVSADNSAIAKAQAQLITDSAASAAQRASDQAAIDAATAQRDSHALVLNSAKATLNEASNNVGKWQETATITQLGAGPDSRRFVANLSHDISRDDTLKLSVVNGLLSSARANSLKYESRGIPTASVL